MFATSLSNKKLCAAAAFIVAAAFLSSCAPHQARRRGATYLMSGEASWYGPGFAGRKTASGERYNPRAMTAAHRTLPFGTTLRVTNRDNGRSVLVRINDRGPFVGGRIIDLSKSAAERIGMIGAGTATVELASLSAPGRRTQVHASPSKHPPRRSSDDEPDAEGNATEEGEDSEGDAPDAGGVGSLIAGDSESAEGARPAIRAQSDEDF